MENHGPPPTDPLVRSVPPSDWYRTPSEARPRVETPMVPDLDPDVAMWGNGGVMIWPFSGAPTIGGFQRGQVGVDNTGTMYVCTVTGHPGTWSAVGSGGGGGANSPIVRAFPFAFNTPNLATGAALYTPTVGDWLLDAWIEVDTAWNGTTPRGDFGTLISGTGWLAAQVGFTANMAQADADITGGSPDDGFNEGKGVNGFSAMTSGYIAERINITRSGTNPVLLTSGTQANADNGTRWQLKCVVANPIMMVVSQDGSTTGGDPGSSQGSGVLYLETVTPT